MIDAALQKAIDNLEIQDVYVRDQVASFFGDFDPKYAEDIDSLNVQQMHIVRKSEAAEIDDGTLTLRVFIRLGARWIDPTIEEDDASVRALIEAEFVAEYRMKKILEEECINQFCLKNVSYHIWPYWRELLSNQCMRMYLPKLMLPVVQLAHNRHQQTPEDH